MAIVQSQVATVTFSLIDETGSSSNCSLSAPAATLVATLVAEIATLIPLIEAITDAKITGWNIVYHAAENAPVGPAVGSRVERKGLFVFTTGVGGKYARVQVPSILTSVLVDGGRIDEDNAAVGAFLLEVANGPWSDSNGNDITGLRQAYERYNRSTRQMLPSKRIPDVP